MDIFYQFHYCFMNNWTLSTKKLLSSSIANSFNILGRTLKSLTNAIGISFTSFFDCFYNTIHYSHNHEKGNRIISQPLKKSICKPMITSLGIFIKPVLYLRSRSIKMSISLSGRKSSRRTEPKKANFLMFFLQNVIVKKCHFDIVIWRFSQPPVSPFDKLTRVGF